MRRTSGRNDWCVADEGVVNAWIGNQIGLELVQVDVQRAIKSQGGRHRADNLRNKSIQMLIVGSRNIKIAAADVVDSFIVDEKCAVGVFYRAVG